MCFGTRSGTAVKSGFQKSLHARLKERRSGPQLEETLIDPLFTDVAFRRDSEGDGSGHYESGGVMSPLSPVPSARLHTPRVPSNGSRHHVSTVALNGQTALQSAFRHYVILAKKH